MSKRRPLLLVALTIAVLLVLFWSATSWLELGPDSSETAVVEGEDDATAGSGQHEADDRSRRRRGERRGGESGAGEGEGDDADGNGSGGTRGAGSSGGESGEDDASGDGESADDESAGDDGDATEDPEDPSERRWTVRGRVRVPEGAPSVDGARVLVVGHGVGWYGTRVNADGTFEAHATVGFREQASGFEVRIRGQGYRIAIVPFEGEDEVDVVVPLEIEEVPPALGSLDLLVTDADGRVFEGPVLLTCYDAMGDHHGRLVRTDAGGNATLLGLSPGPWRIRAIGGPRSVDATVPSGASAGAHVHVGDWPGTLTAEEFEQERARIGEGVPPGVVDEEEAVRERRRVLEIQDLEQRWRILRPQRSVRLDATSWPTEDGDLLRVTAMWGPGVSWVVRRRAETVTTLTLSPERWSVSLLRGGETYALAEFDAAPPEPSEPAEGEAPPPPSDPGPLEVDLPRPDALAPDAE